MDEFLGILFAGGRGTRLGLITQYISKALVPVDDRPVFMYPLAQLEASSHIREILILTNRENDAKIKQAGYQTLIQDDNTVHDMLSGLQFIRRELSGDRNCVLMPCDNISDISVDRVVEAFLRSDCEICFSLTSIPARDKLSQMGVYDPVNGRLVYKPAEPPSEWGVIAPYVVRGTFNWNSGRSDVEVLNQAATCHEYHYGYWFDIGDPESLTKCIRKLAAGIPQS